MNALLVFGIACIVGFGLFKGYPYLYLTITAMAEIRKMNKTCLKTGAVLPDIVTARDGHANVYLINTQDGYVAIDAGEKRKSLKATLARLGVRPEEVTDIFLTHSDFDHCGAIELFDKAMVYLSEAEEVLIDGRQKRTFTKYRIPWTNKLKRPYTTLDDGDVLTIGGRTIQCILTPGHTPGSMCYLVDGRYLFTGDTVRLEGGRFQRFVEVFTMDTPENERSIKKLVAVLRGRTIEHVFSAHHGRVDDYPYATQGW